ncbi:hypothetical protein DFJ74DRAFT_680213 [Hyaloraphidium curvatum]|nr:hypothetical protein DFJ74DRAFT_680213 [Hyaloraphidium curvatum]
MRTTIVAVLLAALLAAMASFVASAPRGGELEPRDATELSAPDAELSDLRRRGPDVEPNAPKKTTSKKRKTTTKRKRTTSKRAAAKTTAKGAPKTTAKPFSPNQGPTWITLPNTWCNEVAWMRLNNGVLQCHGNGDNPPTDCNYYFKCVLNPRAHPGCSNGAGYLGPGGPKETMRWFTPSMRNLHKVENGKTVDQEYVSYPYKQLGWLHFHNGTCDPYCPMKTVKQYIEDGQGEDCQPLD